eukprot:730763-Pleurochrysis_carterae.AAC.1
MDGRRICATVRTRASTAIRYKEAQEQALNSLGLALQPGLCGAPRPYCVVMSRTIRISYNGNLSDGHRVCTAVKFKVSIVMRYKKGTVSVTSYTQ